MIIKKIFIPEKIGTYYVLPKYILGFQVTKTHVYATYILMQGESISIKQCLQEPIEAESTRPLQERTSKAIKKIIDDVQHYDEIRTSLPSSIAIIKQLVLPFTDREKIEKVLPFEIEPHLPFAVQDAVIDFIPTKQDEDQSVILVAAVPKQFVAEHLALFESININPNAITIDLFDVYGLYSSIPYYTEKKQNVALIDIDFNITRIAYIDSNQLQFTRSIPQGLNNIAKSISQTLKMTNGEALETIIRFGLKNPENKKYLEALNKQLEAFWQKIQFTLNSFTKKTTPQKSIDTILLLGPCTEIPGFIPYITEKSNIHCELFDPHYLLKNKNISVKQKHPITQQYIISLSTALPNKITQNFNLRRQEFSISTAQLTAQRLITAGILMILTLVALLFHSYWQVGSYRKSVNAAEKEVIIYLQEEGLSDARSLNEALIEAEEKVNKEQAVWFAFSRQQRFSFLQHLQDLSTAIDRESIGLNLKKLTITEDAITMDGSVKNYEALKILERELSASNLFRALPTSQDTSFTNLTLPLKKNNGVTP